ncbi:hypothetical protein LTS08_001054 [Lithohypha guttulata]|uniref:Uncharacterized protein n=1 Tax=Lithohypha guttulata TaxID=1690604 RepID=A0AAN7Y8C1_9EURO|nr:hypothetical protein LTR05_002760 [Lithohypha guttulata]KAK5106931.1 hypothetical protein LTS08_001054 [Lithohypha guttulata]
MSKPKTHLKQFRGKKRTEQILNDADDYLAAAVDDEDAMGKHRGGDALKSIRFGRKALELYSQGLKKYPQSFDLAYNKARLELELATHPVLVRVLDVPIATLLQQSFSSHQYALQIVPDDADTLFNAAQVLTALAEQIGNTDDDSDAQALRLLEQALEYQQECLRVQELNYAETRAIQNRIAHEANDSEDDDGGAKIDSSTTTAFEDREAEEQWFSIVEPVTASTLMDTLLAQMSTLTTLCSIVVSALSSNPDSQPRISLSWIETYYTKLVTIALPALLEADKQALQSRMGEAALTQALLRGTLLELAYRTTAIDLETYKKEIDAAFSVSELDTTSSADPLLAHAKSLISFNGALVDTIQIRSGNAIDAQANVRWNALSRAQKLLAAAASLDSAKADTTVLAMTHLLRGDTSLLLHALSYPPTSFTPAITSKAQLLKNAEVFYRNASKLMGSAGQDEGGSKDVAGFRCGVVQVLQSSDATTDQIIASNIIQALSSTRNDDWRREQLRDMVDEGLVGTLFDLQ